MNIRRTFIYRNVYTRLKYCASYIYRLLPIRKNKIVFDNFTGKGYGCDPKYICEELRSRPLQLDLVWLSQNDKEDLPAGVRCVKYGSYRAFYELATAQIWVDNVKNSLKPKKRKGQFYLQTWHSSLGLKMNEKDAIDTVDKSYVKTSMKDAAQTDLMYADNEFRADRYRNAFWYNGPVILCGTPRNSIFFSKSKRYEKKVRSAFSLDDQCKIAVYAPTFRKDYDLGCYKFDYLRCVSVLEEKFGGHFVLLMRLHPNAAVLSGELIYNNRVLDASKYPDIQELIAASELLITDYSGCMFDACFAGKPVFIFASDYEKYVSRDRKLYFDAEQLPFRINITEDELINDIRSYDVGEYHGKCRHFFDLIGLHEDGTGAKEIADILVEKCSLT